MFVGGAAGPTPPSGWALVATGDFNNDGKPDYVLYNASTRQTAVWFLNNNVFVGGANGPTLPAAWSLVGVADFNKDGKRDYLLFNLTTRQTAIWYLSVTTRIGSAFGPTIAVGYNLSGAADFNRDGKPDYLLFNPAPAKQRFGTSITMFALAPLSVQRSPLAGPWRYLEESPPSRNRFQHVSLEEGLHAHTARDRAVCHHLFMLNHRRRHNVG